MEAPIRIAVRAELASCSVNLARVLQIRVKALSIVVRVDEVVAGVVRRVDVNHLDLAEVRLLKKLQYFKIVTFNDQIFGALKIHALFRARQERAKGGSLNGIKALGLASPTHAV